ncbi:MAG: type ISP restriction/modification enzyme, partial [Anaerolineales bacterium]
KGQYFEWPQLTDLFPIALNGAQFKRTWPIGETAEVLLDRWRHLVGAPASQRKALFRETEGWKITKKIKEDLPGKGEPSIFEATSETAPPRAIDYSFRSYDRRKAFYDFRLGDRLRPDLFSIHGNKQVFLTTLMTNALAEGQAIMAAAHIPDLHHFRGSFGGKDVVPIYRDAAGRKGNLTSGLLDRLAAAYGFDVSVEDFAAYVYALLGGQSYTARFWNELETPGPRVPLTKVGATFSKTVALGRRLIWLHTYAEKFRGKGRGDRIPTGAAKCITAVSSTSEGYPEDFAYNVDTCEVRLGDGRVVPVTPEIWEFEVSGLKVVQSWLGYRMKVRTGKKSSPLDEIRPKRWTARMTDELLELIWVLEATLAMEPELSAALDAVVGSKCFGTSELPSSVAAERKPSRSKVGPGGLLALMETGKA